MRWVLICIALCVALSGCGGVTSAATSSVSPSPLSPSTARFLGVWAPVAGRLDIDSQGQLALHAGGAGAGSKVVVTTGPAGIRVDISEPSFKYGLRGTLDSDALTVYSHVAGASGAPLFVLRPVRAGRLAASLPGAAAGQGVVLQRVATLSGP